MAIDTRTPAEIAYDAMRLSPAPVAQPSLLGVALPTLEQQIARCGPHDFCESRDLFVAELPNGVTISRGTCDATPADWIGVDFGEASTDVLANGSIIGLYVGGHCMEEMTMQEVRELHTLLSFALENLDALAQLAKLDSATERAVSTWSKREYATKRRTATTIGFAEWYRTHA